MKLRKCVNLSKSSKPAAVVNSEQTTYLNKYVECLFVKDSKSLSLWRYKNTTHFLGKGAIQCGWLKNRILREESDWRYMRHLGARMLKACMLCSGVSTSYCEHKAISIQEFLNWKTCVNFIFLLAAPMQTKRLETEFHWLAIDQIR